MSGRTLNEAFAASMWCPFVRAESEAGGINRDDTGEVRGWACCVGSCCMAWRVETPAVPLYEEHEGHRPPDDRDDWYSNSGTVAEVIIGEVDAIARGEATEAEVGAWKYDWSRLKGERPEYGYCGLAGKP